MNEEIRSLIAVADRAIKEERFDDLMEFYTDDAVLGQHRAIAEKRQCHWLMLLNSKKYVENFRFFFMKASTIRLPGTACQPE